MHVNYAKAQSFIADHGHFVAVTADGLLAITGAIYTDGRDDKYEDEAEVFPIAEDGTVNSRAIRAWLGY